MVLPLSEMVIVMCVIFTYCKWRSLFGLRLLLLAPGKKNVKLQISQLFGQLIVGSIEKCFVCFVSVPTVTALFLPRSDLGCGLAL